MGKRVLTIHDGEPNMSQSVDFKIELDSMDDGKGYCKSLEVYAEVYINDDECFVKAFELYDNDNNYFVLFDSLPKVVQLEIERKIEQYIYDKQDYFFQQAREALCDYYYDCMRGDN